MHSDVFMPIALRLILMRIYVYGHASQAQYRLDCRLDWRYCKPFGWGYILLTSTERIRQLTHWMVVTEKYGTTNWAVKTIDLRRFCVAIAAVWSSHPFDTQERFQLIYRMDCKTCKTFVCVVMSMIKVLLLFSKKNGFFNMNYFVF